MKDAVFSWSIEQGLIYCSSSCYSGQQSSHTGLACVAVISSAVRGENSDGPAAVPIWKHMVRWNNSNILDASICLLLCTSDVVVNKKEGKLWPSFDNHHEGKNRNTNNSYVFGGTLHGCLIGGGVSPQSRTIETNFLHFFITLPLGWSQEAATCTSLRPLLSY